MPDGAANGSAGDTEGVAAGALCQDGSSSVTVGIGGALIRMVEFPWAAASRKLETAGAGVITPRSTMFELLLTAPAGLGLELVALAGFGLVPVELAAAAFEYGELPTGCKAEGLSTAAGWMLGRAFAASVLAMGWLVSVLRWLFQAWGCVTGPLVVVGVDGAGFDGCVVVGVLAAGGRVTGWGA